MVTDSKVYIVVLPVNIMVKREAYKENNGTAKVGRAYGFFAYDGKTENVLDELPRARNLAQTPNEMGLELTEVDNLHIGEDSALAGIVEKAKQQNMTHALEASMPGVGNRKVSGEVAAIMNNIYASPLYAPGEQFCAGIVYKRGEKYCFRS